MEDMVVLELGKDNSVQDKKDDKRFGGKKMDMSAVLCPA